MAGLEEDVELLRLLFEQARESADVGMPDGQHGQHAAADQQQHALHDVVEDVGLQPAVERVGGGHGGQQADGHFVADGVLRIGRERGDRQRAEDHRADHLDQQERHVGDRVHQPAAIVEPAAEIFRERVQAHAAIERQKEVAQHQQAEDGAELEIGLGESFLQPGPHHAHHVVRADVGAEDRAGHGPPGDGLAGQVIVAGVVFLASDPHAERRDAHHAGDQDQHVEPLQRHAGRLGDEQGQ